MLRIDRTSNNTEQIVTIGQEIEISLPENPTTGFRWEVQAGGDPALSLMNDAFDPPQAGLGTAGTRRWRFTAAREGPGSVVIVYRRAFERDKPPADVFRFTARVQQ